jgi:hypothetical protein
MRQRRDPATSSANQPAANRRPHAEAGFSLLEVLIASLLLLFIALGTIPMFTMAQSSNLQGSENTRAANYARQRLEEMWQLPFNSDPLTIVAGTERAHTEYLDPSSDQERWLPLVGTPPDGTLFTRHTVIRQFSAEDTEEEPISAEVAEVDPARVQLKEITVAVDSLRTGGPLGAGKSVEIRGFKAQ